MVEAYYFCPCRGYPALGMSAYELLGPPPWGDLGEPPYAPRLGAPSYDCCDCCGFEFGFDDEPGAGAGVSFAQYLRNWVARGCRWFYPDKRPVDWCLKAQLLAAGIAESDHQNDGTTGNSVGS